MAEVTGLKGRFCFHAWIIAGEDLGDSSEDVVEPQTVPYFMDHCMGVSRYAIEGRIQHNSACKEREIVVFILIYAETSCDGCFPLGLVEWKVGKTMGGGATANDRQSLNGCMQKDRQLGPYWGW